MLSFEDADTIKDIVNEIPSVDKSHLNNNLVNHVLIKEENDDEILKSGTINLYSNKDVIKKEKYFSFENFMTAYETKEKGHILTVIPLFFDSVIDMLNYIIKSYDYHKMLLYININSLIEKLSINIIKHMKLLDIITFDYQNNKDIIFSIIEIERKKGKTVFEVLVNFNFEELYEYFINDGTIITWGWYIYDLSGIFKTLVDVTKERKGLFGKKYKLELLDIKEIETIILDNSKAEEMV